MNKTPSANPLIAHLDATDPDLDDTTGVVSTEIISNQRAVDFKMSPSTIFHTIISGTTAKIYGLVTRVKSTRKYGERRNSVSHQSGSSE